MWFIGIDLAGSEKRSTGFAALNNKMDCITKILKSDNEIIKEILNFKPIIIVIDAPLSLPKGRKSLKEKSNIHFRKCDLELKRLNIKFFPITLGPMRKLTERGIRIKNILEKKGFEVVESFPGAIQDILSIPRKKNLEGLKNGIKKLGIRINLEKKVSGDELDAITLAYLGKLIKEKKFLVVGEKDEGFIYLPKV